MVRRVRKLRQSRHGATGTFACKSAEGRTCFRPWDVNEVYAQTCVPLSIYAGNPGEDEPNENPTSNRAAVGHRGMRAPAKCSPGELAFGTNHDPSYGMPRVVSDLVAAVTVHLAIIDGIESQTSAELPRTNVTRPVAPRVLIAGLNRVCTDSVAATAVMGYNPRARRGDPGFRQCDNQLVLAEQRGLGTCDLQRIDVRGTSIEQAMQRYDI